MEQCVRAKNVEKEYPKNATINNKINQTQGISPNDCDIMFGKIGYLIQYKHILLDIFTWLKVSITEIVNDPKEIELMKFFYYQ